jgi:hypothetical protein
MGLGLNKLPGSSPLPLHFLTYISLQILERRYSQMPSYCLQDCHYFYRSALRLLSIPTVNSPIYA